MKDAYVEFKRTMTPTFDPRTRQAATVSTGRSGGGRSRQTGRGGGQKTGDSRKKGLIPQGEINKQTHIVNKEYPPDEYKRFTPAEKAKLWQLRHPGQTPRPDMTVTLPLHRHRRLLLPLLANLSIN